jgi:hypothetical protein
MMMRKPQGISAKQEKHWFLQTLMQESRQQNGEEAESGFREQVVLL